MSASMIGSASISDGMSYRNQHLAMGGSNIPLKTGSIPGLQNGFVSNWMNNLGAGINGKVDNNNPNNSPWANIPTNVPYMLDTDRQNTYDWSAGAFGFVHRDETKKQVNPVNLQLSWVKDIGSVNHYLECEEGFDIHRKCRSGYELAQIWSLRGLIWSEKAPEGSTVATSPTTLNFHMNGIIETKDIWAWNRTVDKRGVQIGGLQQGISQLYFIYTRIPKANTLIDIKSLYKNEEDHYHWVILPYHQDTGAGLEMDLSLLFSDLNPESPNYHIAYVQHIGHVTQLINRTSPNLSVKSIAERTLFPKKLCNDKFLAFNSLPRIQVEFHCA
jgi:hypothetical protein